MKKFKRLISLVLVTAMAFVLASCGSKELSDTIRVGALNGPTGMGMVNLMDEELIDLTTYQAADEVVQKLVSDDIDIAAVPSNLASVLYNKTDGQIVALTTICSGVLYLVENGNEVDDLDDLEGKTIYASGKGGTPEYVLSILLEEEGLTIGEDVQVQWLDAHADVAQMLLQNSGAVALLPEPFVSNVTSKSDAVKVAVDLNEEWTDEFEQSLPMGVLIAKKSFVEERADDVAIFLEKVSDSVDAVNTASDEIAEKIVDAGFLADVEIAKSAIPRCNISCMSPEDSQATLSAFFNVLYKFAPQSVGGALPGDDIYYTGK